MPHLQLLTKKTFDKVPKFIQTMCYSEMEDQSVTETRVRVYKQLKTKTSPSTPPDKNSLLQAIKRIYCQLYYWLQSDMAVIPEIDLSENSWMISAGNVLPVCFVGKGLSPNLVFNIKKIWAKWLTPFLPEIIKNHRFSEFQRKLKLIHALNFA